jgi:hypothetical protein
MSVDLHHHIASHDNGPEPACSSKVWLQYQSQASPVSFEPAPVSRALGDTILNALGRDDRLRLAYVRRRWQGLTQ